MSLGSDYLRSLLEEDPERGVYRCKREMFTDPRLFELEMKHIFEGNWVYLAHESQVAGVNDYLTTQIGRQSIVIARNRDGQLQRLHQRLQPPWRDALPAQERQSQQLYLSVPRLDLQQLRQAAQGQGPGRGRLPAGLQLRGLARPDPGGALRVLPWLPVRQPQPRCQAAGRAPGRVGEDHRHDRRPVAGRPRGAARLFQLCLRRQLEAHRRERRRRLPRQLRCTGTTRRPRASASSATPRTRCGP